MSRRIPDRLMLRYIYDQNSPILVPDRTSRKARKLNRNKPLRFGHLSPKLRPSVNILRWPFYSPGLLAGLVVAAAVLGFRTIHAADA